MTSEFNQIINLVKSKNEKIEHISYKEVYKLKLNPENNNNTAIVFNTQNISSQLIDYSNAYFQLVNINIHYYTFPVNVVMVQLCLFFCSTFEDGPLLNESRS